MNLCVKISNRFPFKGIEGWALIRGGRLFEDGSLLDIPVSRTGDYSMGVLNQSITVIIYRADFSVNLHARAEQISNLIVQQQTCCPVPIPKKSCFPQERLPKGYYGLAYKFLGLAN